MRRVPARSSTSCHGRGAVATVKVIVGFGLALGLGLGGCSKPSPRLSIFAASSYSGLECAPADRHIVGLPSARSVRLSVRQKDETRKVIGLCDAMLDLSAAKTWGFPIGARKVDLFVEVFGGDGDGKNRIASGALLDVDPTSAEPPPLLVYEAEEYRCTPETRLKVPRAFHTATRLDNGHVLLVGGLTANAGGLDKAAPDSATNPGFFATASVELYDPATRTITVINPADSGKGVARAFHRAAVVGTPQDGRYTLLLIGGVTPVSANNPVARADRAMMVPTVPNGFRLSVDSNDNAAIAPTELMVYDSLARPPTVTYMAASAAVQDASGLLQGSVELAGGGVLLAGGTRFVNKAPEVQSLLASTIDGVAVQKMAISAPRSGATLAPFRDASGATPSALLVGGLAAGGDMVKPFETIEVMGLKSTPHDATIAALPVYYLPTVTAMDPPGTPAPRFLISGGLEVKNNGSAINPPAAADITMYQVQWNGAAMPLQTLAATATRFKGSACTKDNDHFKVVAFDAASLLPSGDRVLVTGGTPRDESGMNGCRECEESDNLACAVSQSVVVDVPASAAKAPEITRMKQLRFARFGHSQTVLDDGMVLIAGGLTRRGMDSFAVAQTEIFNPARQAAAASISEGTNSAEPDDPLRRDILGSPTPLTREAGGLMFAAGDPNKNPAQPCVAPTR